MLYFDYNDARGTNYINNAMRTQVSSNNDMFLSYEHQFHTSKSNRVCQLKMINIHENEKSSRVDHRLVIVYEFDREFSTLHFTLICIVVKRAKYRKIK